MVIGTVGTGTDRKARSECVETDGPLAHERAYGGEILTPVASTRSSGRSALLSGQPEVQQQLLVAVGEVIEKSTFVLSLPFSLFAFQPEDREKLYTRGCSDMVSSKNGKVDGINARDSSAFRTALQNRRSREKSRLAVILHSESIEERIRRKSWIGNKRCV